MRRQTRTEFRHDPSDKARWQEAAEARGLTLSEFLRMAADAATTGASLSRPPSITYERMDPAKLRELRGACNNLNQVVHAGHVVKNFDLARIEALAAEIAAAVRDDLARAAEPDGKAPA
ncbi:MAG: hypothetical protein AB7E80_01645 [Hyphomicrobiaceae bacterium]